MSAKSRWAIVIAYVALLYSSLGFTRHLVNALQGKELLQIASVSVFLFSLGCVALIRWRKIRPYQKIIRLALVFILIVGGIILKLPEERMHLVQYGILGGLVSWAFWAGKQKTVLKYSLSCALVWLIGYGDELIQYFLPSRVYDVKDVLLNGFSGMVGLLLLKTY